jgi:hypothetical protein
MRIGLATVILAFLVEPAEARVHLLHLFVVRVKSLYREMHFRLKETFTDCTATENGVVFTFFVSDDLLDGLAAAGAARNADIQVTTGAYLCATVCFSLGDVLASFGYPSCESFEAATDIVP